jgi:hypothetical protein
MYMMLLRTAHLCVQTKINVVLPTPNTFESNVLNSCNLCLLRMFQDFPMIPGSGVLVYAKRFYKRLCRLLVKGVNNFGHPGANHMIVVLTVLGLVPEWTYHQCTLDPASEGYKYLVVTSTTTRFKLESGSSNLFAKNSRFGT